MLDLDKYINNTVKIKLFEEEYDILEPTIEMVGIVKHIESELTEENVHDKEVDVLLLMINHNVQKKVFKKNELIKLPFEAISRTVAEISTMRYEAEHDPNSKSQFQTVK